MSCVLQQILNKDVMKPKWAKVIKYFPYIFSRCCHRGVGGRESVLTLTHLQVHCVPQGLSSAVLVHQVTGQVAGSNWSRDVSSPRGRALLSQVSG